MNKIDVIKKKKKLSYNFIAERAGLTATYIHFLAKGKRNNPSLKAMQQIAGALGEATTSVFPSILERIG